MEVKKITEGMTAPQVAQVIDDNFKGIIGETDAKLTELGSEVSIYGVPHILYNRVAIFGGEERGKLSYNEDYDCIIVRRLPHSSHIYVEGANVFNILTFTSFPEINSWLSTTVNSDAEILENCRYIVINLPKAENQNGYANTMVYFDNSDRVNIENNSKEIDKCKEDVNNINAQFITKKAIFKFLGNSAADNIKLQFLWTNYFLKKGFKYKISIDVVNSDGLKSMTAFGNYDSYSLAGGIEVFTDYLHSLKEIEVSPTKDCFLTFNSNMIEGTEVDINVLEIINLPNEIDKDSDVILCIGDSLTHGYQTNVTTSYPDELQNIIGTSYKVMNGGYDGQNTKHIISRTGACPMVLTRDINVPSVGIITLGTMDDPGFKMLIAEDDSVKPLQYMYLYGEIGMFNPCIIDGVEFYMSYSGTYFNDPNGRYKLQRLNVGKEKVVKANTPIQTLLSTYSSPKCVIIKMGANDGKQTSEYFIEKYRYIVNYYAKSNIIIVLDHVKRDYYSLEETIAIENDITKAFGLKVLNTRLYFSTQAIYDANISPTENDLTAMNNGTCPPSLLVDNIHFNDIGYRLLAKIIHRRCIELNYL